MSDETKHRNPERRTMNLWPDAGRRLGVSKNLAYEAAARGEIVGCFRIGNRWLVSIEPFERALQEQTAFGSPRTAGL
jgi:hypothetical protein